MALSFPEFLELDDYDDYLKKDKDEYILENGKVLDEFCIYSHRFDGDDYWMEY